MLTDKLKKQIGRLFIIGYQGCEPEEDFLKFVEEWGIGGVIVFARNLNDPADLPQNLAKIEEASGNKIFKAIDQEGGLVMRILKHGSLFPSAMGLAAIDNPETTRKIHEAIGREMLSLGLNWNLAPVLDINHPENPGIGARSFSENPETVARHGISAIKGLQDSGVLACAKHFPGKGHAKVDSHLNLPVIPYEVDRLEAFELLPFKQAIANAVDAIMTAHVFFPAFEKAKNLPATLSQSVLTDLLRTKLGFQGLIVTDDLEMGAITESFGIATAAEKSFLAGADLLLICHQLEQQKQAAEIILRKVATDKSYAKRLEESLERINAARQKISGTLPCSSIQELKKRHAPIIECVHDSMVRFLRADNTFLPLNKNDKTLVFLIPQISALVQVEEDHGQSGMEEQIRQFFPQARIITYTPSANPDQLPDIEQQEDIRIQNCRIVVFSYNAHLLPNQHAFIENLSDKCPSMAVVALRNPYDLSRLKKVKTLGAAFSFRSPAIKSVLLALSGESRLIPAPWPVDVNNWNLD